MPNAQNCEFCKIVSGDSADTNIEFDNERIVIFKDAKPASDYHYLAVPKVHIEDGRKLTLNDKDLILEMQNQLRELIRKKGVVLSDVSYGFHWPPFLSVRHLHMHAIAPASRMSFVSKYVFKPINIWYRTPEYVLANLLEAPPK